MRIFEDIPEIVDIPTDNTAGLNRVVAESLMPAPNITISEWADRYRILTSSQSSEPGQWRTSRVPFLKEIMDRLSPLDSQQRIVVMKSARVGFTEGCINNTIGAYMHLDPCPLLMVQPTENDAKEWSKDSLDPMLEATPALQGLVSTDKIKHKGNTLLHKQFRGGVIYMRSASTAKSFRRILARLVLCDERDAWVSSVDGEGDPAMLAESRATTFPYTRKILHGSTPTIKEESPIAREYEASSQARYHVPCPDCGAFQELVWEQVVYDKTQPDLATYQCIHCKGLIEHRHKEWMMSEDSGAHWVHKNPDHPTLGYHISALYSPWVTWGKLAQEWLSAHGDPAAEQVFWNTALGRVWDIASREEWDIEGLNKLLLPIPKVPATASVLTAGIDCQRDRFAIQVDAWGAGEERWTLGRWDILGDPSAPEIWEELRQFLYKSYPVEGGGYTVVSAFGMDTGGSYTQQSWDFCVRNHLLNVWGLKGSSNFGYRIWPRQKKFRPRAKYSPIMVGVSAAKEVLYQRLRRSIEIITKEGRLHRDAALWHFNQDGLTDGYFDELTAETLVVEYSRARSGVGTPKKRWILKSKGRKNESLDISVYSYAVLHGLMSQGAVELETPLRALDYEPAVPNPTPPTKNRTNRPRKVKQGPTSAETTQEKQRAPATGHQPHYARVPGNTRRGGRKIVNREL